MSTVLIAAPEHLPALTSRPDLAGAQAFNDGEALRALEAITRNRPKVVVLESLFAATPRGSALINRIKADPKLASCEVRIVAHDSEYVRTTVVPASPPADEGEGTIAVVEAPPEEGLDAAGTRRAPRFRIAEGVELMVDGNPAALLDLSVLGAQVVSPTVLRPNQRVRVIMADGRRPIRVNAGVVWASFELAATGPQYRAGLEFFDADSMAVEKFCKAKQRD